MENWFRKIQPYLPSKKFSLVIGLVAGVTLLIIFGSSIFGSRSSFLRGARNAPLKARGTLGDVIERDSNKNGIPDWEESLWGLDPKGNGKENKQLIEEQKKEKGITENSNEGIPKTESDIFVQDLLTTILALNQTGSLTPEAVGNIAKEIDNDIDSKREIIKNYYEKEDLNLINVTEGSLNQYKTDIASIASRYSQGGIGKEFEIIADSLDENESSLNKLTDIKNDYFSFAKELIELQTPRSLSVFVLQMANTSRRIGVALEKIQKIYTDVLTGMVGVDEFIQASDDFVRAEAMLADYLERNP